MAKAKKAAAKIKVKRFEASDFLKSEAAIEEFLAAAMEDPNPDVFLAALGEVAKVRGIAALARAAGSAAKASTRPSLRVRSRATRRSASWWMRWELC